MNQTPRAVILVTIDCLRADHVGFLGYAGGTTPFLDSLAGESFVFRNAIASGIPTYYSLPALLASRYPLSLGRDIIGLAPGESSIATEMKEFGFSTAAFIAGNPYASARFGYSNGFEVFCDFLEASASDCSDDIGQEHPSSFRHTTNAFLSRASRKLPALGRAYEELYFRYCQAVSRSEQDSLDSLRNFPSADVIVDSAIAWLEQNSSSPFFLWLHFMDPHGPYYPRAAAFEAMGYGETSATEAKYLNSYWARGDLAPASLCKKRAEVVKLYDAGVRWADAELSRLAAKLVELNIWNQCLLAVTADHGEEFLDHGGRFHSPFKLHEELVHVPLLMRIPGFTHQQQIEEPFGLIDLAPTLLDALGVSAPASFRGRSCWRKLLAQQTWTHPVITECAYRCTNPFHAEARNSPRLLAVRKGNHKLIINFASGEQELFDLASDPNESNPLPLGPCDGVRKELLKRAKQHVAESYKSRDLDLWMAAKARDLRIEWAHSSPRTI